MKTLLFAIFALFSLQIIAQDDDNIYFQLDTEQSYYLLADDVNVRSKAALKADIVTKIPIGTKLTLIEMDKTSLKLNGFNAPWYKVSFQEKGATQTGYIWGGFISLLAENHQLAGGELMLFGLSKIEKQKNSDYPDKVTMQVRICKDNKELQKLEYDGSGSSSTNRAVTISSSKGVNGIKNILNIEYSDNYCGGAFGNHIIFWNGKKLQLIKHLVSGADAPCYASEDFIFPEDEGGKAGLILLKSEAGCDEELEEGETEPETTYDHRYMEEYSWKNNKLVFLKKYDIK